MARSFERSNSEYFDVNEAIVATPPFTMAGWAYLFDDTTAHCVVDVSVQYGTNKYHVLVFRGNIEGNPLRVASWDGSGGGGVNSTSGYSANTWHHACGVWAATNSRKVYLDGDSSAEDPTEVAPSGLNRTGIGALVKPSPSAYVDGYLAEVGIWNAALTEDEIAALAKGYSPLLIRPASLVSYRDFINLLDLDYVGDRTWTEHGTIDWAADHPGMIYPTRPQHGIKKPAPSVKPWWYHQRAAMRRAN